MFVCLDIKKERIERSKKVEKYCAISSIHARHSNENIFFFAQFFFFFRSINIFPRNELVFSSIFTQIVVCSRMENTWYSIFFPIVYISFLGKTREESWNFLTNPRIERIRVLILISRVCFSDYYILREEKKF